MRKKDFCERIPKRIRISKSKITKIIIRRKNWIEKGEEDLSLILLNPASNGVVPSSVKKLIKKGR